MLAAILVVSLWFLMNSHLALSTAWGLSWHADAFRWFGGRATQWLPHYSLATKAMLDAPVRVALETSHFFGSKYAGHVPNCTYYDHPLKCEFIDTPSSNDSASADVLWYHAPSFCQVSRALHKTRPEQLTVVMSMESAAYYSCLDKKEYMQV